MAKHGGVRKGAGRKKKVDEDRVVSLALDAVVSIYGSEREYFEFLAKEGKASFPHLKMLHEYAFGKVPETINQKTEIVVPEIEWANE